MLILIVTLQFEDKVSCHVMLLYLTELLLSYYAAILNTNPTKSLLTIETSSGLNEIFNIFNRIAVLLGKSTYFPIAVRNFD